MLRDAPAFCSRRAREQAAQDRLPQRFEFRLPRIDSFRRQRRNQLDVASEVARAYRQLTGEQPSSLGGKARSRTEPRLDLVAERSLQRDDGELRPQLAWRRIAANGKPMRLLHDSGPQAIRPRQRFQSGRPDIVEPERLRYDATVAQIRPRRLRGSSLPQKGIGFLDTCLVG